MVFAPKVSVIIPTYNRVSQIADAIESVLAQTYANLEIIVVDDGSKDNTAAVVQPYERKHGERVRYYWQKNGGKSVALNNALARVSGDLIAFLDSDDVWLPDKLEWQLRAAAKFGPRYPSVTDATYVNNPRLQQTTAFAFAKKKYAEEIAMIANPTALFLDTRSGIYTQTLVIPRDLAERVGEFDPKLRVGNDTDYLFRLALVTPFCIVNKPLVQIDRTMNREDGLIEQITRDEYLRTEEHQYMYEKWLALTQGGPRTMRKQLLERLSEAHNDWANWHLAHREYGKARKSMSKSLATQFTAKAAVKLALATFVPSIARREYQRRDLERARHRVIA